MPSPSMTTTIPGHGGGDAGSDKKNGTAISAMTRTITRSEVQNRQARDAERSRGDEGQRVGEREPGAGKMAAGAEATTRDDRVGEVAGAADRSDDRSRHQVVGLGQDFSHHGAGAVAGL